MNIFAVRGGAEDAGARSRVETEYADFEDSAKGHDALELSKDVWDGGLAGGVRQASPASDSPKIAIARAILDLLDGRAAHIDAVWKAPPLSNPRSLEGSVSMLPSRKSAATLAAWFDSAATAVPPPVVKSDVLERRAEGLRNRESRGTSLPVPAIESDDRSRPREARVSGPMES